MIVSIFLDFYPQNQFVDPKIVQFGPKNIKIGRKLADLANYLLLVQFCYQNIPFHYIKWGEKGGSEIGKVATVPGRIRAYLTLGHS